MVIFLYGEDDFRSHQKVKEIINRYQSLKGAAFNLRYFDLAEDDVDKLAEFVNTASMFEEKKLVIIENAFLKPELEQNLIKLLENSRQDKDDCNLVFWEKSEPHRNSLLFKKLTAKPALFQRFEKLDDSKLSAWIKKEAARLGGEIDFRAIRKLIAFCGNDLWRLNNEIYKLVNYNCKISEENVDLLVKGDVDSNVFELIDALGRKDKKTALFLLGRELEGGSDEVYILNMITYQFRNLMMVKDQKPNFSLRNAAFGAGRLNLNPYVLKKAALAASNFELSELKNIFRKLVDADLSIKLGLKPPRLALEMLIMKI